MSSYLEAPIPREAAMEEHMVFIRPIAIPSAIFALGCTATFAQTLPTHRIPAALAVEAAAETS
jgi:hypothetical protein